MRRKLCQKCGNKLSKWGKDRNGKQRWRCKFCRQSKIYSKPKITENNHLKLYKQYLLGKKSLVEVAYDHKLEKSGLAKIFKPFRKLEFEHTQMDLTGEPLLIDGFRYAGKMALIAISAPNRAKDWLFCDAENSSTWSEFFTQLKTTPVGIVGDGQKGMKKAIKKYFPDLPFQRCQRHVVAFIVERVGKNPSTRAMRYLKALAEYSVHVKNFDDLERWLHFLDIWERNYLSFVNQKTTYIKDNGKKGWHYTHKWYHMCYSHLINALPNLFTYLWHPKLPNTTNDLEGGINSQLRRQFKLHNGENRQTQRQLISLFLLARQS